MSSVIEAQTSSEPRHGLKRRIAAVVVGLLAIVGVVYGVRYYLWARVHESTDDAFIDAHVVPVATKLAGYVAEVRVTDNQLVKAGAVLVVLDTRDIEARLAADRAELSAAESKVLQAKTQLGVYEANLTQAKAELEAARATAEQAASEAKRYAGMSDGATSEQEKINAEAAGRRGEANVAAAHAKIAAGEAQVVNGQSGVKTAEAAVRQAEAGVRQAEIELAYATITAPAEGRVTRRTVEKGAYLQAGQALLALVPRDVWVTANFKETQLREMRPGQPVTIHIDAYGGRTFRGHVDSIQSGTGSRFSLLPPENATGNFVKVVQRVPVKIVFDEPLPEELVLAPGMSVVPDVRVKK